jgi:hypothetical protein
MMDEIFALLAEGKILEAMEKGEFDNLPGKGKPVIVEDWTGIPVQLQIAYKILKNSGYVPAEVMLQKEITLLTSSLSKAPSAAEKQRLKRELADKTMRYNMLMEKGRG